MNSCFIKNLITSNYRGRLTGILIIRIAWAQLNLARGWCMLFTNLWVYNPGYQPPFNYTSYPWDNDFFQGMMSGWILCNFSESSGAQGESMTLKHFLHFDCKKKHPEKKRRKWHTQTQHTKNLKRWKKSVALVIQFVTFLGWVFCEPFKGLSDLQLGDQKGHGLNHLVKGISPIFLFLWLIFLQNTSKMMWIWAILWVD